MRSLAIAGPSFDPFNTTRGKDRKPQGYQPPELVQAYADQFMAQVSVPPMNWQDERYYETCWLWTGHVRSDGQSFFRPRSLQIPVQRFAYELHVGPMFDSMVARAACDVPRCVTPRHLVLRPKNHNPSMIGADVRAVIRSLHHDHSHSFAELARRFGVSERSVARFCHEHDA